MKLSKKHVIRGLVYVTVGTILYLIMFGRLMPFSSIIIGFEKKEFNKDASN